MGIIIIIIIYYATAEFVNRDDECDPIRTSERARLKCVTRVCVNNNK